MPIFEYTCHDCHHAFEALVRSSTTPECPQCHSTLVGKVGGSMSRDAAPVAIGPCGSCGHPDGPGACALQ